MSAAHADSSQNRLHSKGYSSNPRLDLIEAVDCCCCLPLPSGLALLGLFDLARLGVALFYAAEGLSVYLSADASSLMEPSVQETIEGTLWPSVVLCSFKIFIWVLVYLALCVSATLPLRML